MTAQPEWLLSPGLSDYPATLEAMEARAANIRSSSARELIWLVEHPPLYTAGTSAHADELLAPDRFPVFDAGRGGRYTYHGPGQRVVYVMLDLAKRGKDVRHFVEAMENWVIATLNDFGIHGKIICGKVGVWVETERGPAKIAAIGVRLRRWVSFHGLAINVDPDIEHFQGIVPCGLSEPVTSLRALGIDTDLTTLDLVLARHFPAMLASVSSACPSTAKG